MNSLLPCVQKLKNGNYLLVTIGDGGTALEVNPNNEHIWEGKFDLQFPNGAVYRANRLSGLYPSIFSTIINNAYEDDNLYFVNIDETNQFKYTLYRVRWL